MPEYVSRKYTQTYGENLANAKGNNLMTQNSEKVNGSEGTLSDHRDLRKEEVLLR